MKNVYTVAQVNGYIKAMFTQDFMLNRIYVKGEVSNCKYHGSGHIYFSLKDESGGPGLRHVRGAEKGPLLSHAGRAAGDRAGPGSASMSAAEAISSTRRKSCRTAWAASMRRMKG